MSSLNDVDDDIEEQMTEVLSAELEYTIKLFNKVSQHDKGCLLANKCLVV